MTNVFARGIALGVGIVALGLGACANSSYQSAKMLSPGTNRVSAAVTNYSAYLEDNNSGETGFELMGARGFSEKLELGGKLTYMSFSGFGESQSALTALFVPKYSLTPDKLAIVVPVGAIIAEDDHAYELMPSVVYTRDLLKDVDLHLSGQVLIASNSDLDDSELYLGGTLGVAVSPGGAPWALHPELGFLIPTGDQADLIDYYIHFGLAFHYRFGGPPAPAM